MNAQALIDLRARLAAYTAHPIAWANEPFVPPADGSPWIYLELRALRAEPVSLDEAGQRLIRNDGFLRVHVMIAVQTGLDLPFQIADALISILAMAEFGSITAFASTAPEIGVGTDDGLWNAASFSIPLRWHYRQ